LQFSDFLTVGIVQGGENNSDAKGASEPASSFAFRKRGAGVRTTRVLVE
jgi:hypothetical protein